MRRRTCQRQTRMVTLTRGNGVRNPEILLNRSLVREVVRVGDEGEGVGAMFNGKRPKVKEGTLE